MSENMKNNKLTEEELHISNIICKLLKSGYIKIGVNIEPEYAKAGFGRWNITKSYAIVGNEFIELEEGSVEIIDPINY